MDGTHPFRHPWEVVPEMPIRNDLFVVVEQCIVRVADLDPDTAVVTVTDRRAPHPDDDVVDLPLRTAIPRPVAEDTHPGLLESRGQCRETARVPDVLFDVDTPAGNDGPERYPLLASTGRVL